jgi:hypothetical protein
MTCCKQRTSLEHFFNASTPEEQSFVATLPPVTALEAKTVAARLLIEANRIQLVGWPEKEPSAETLARSKGFRDAADWILKQCQSGGFLPKEQK